MQLGLPVRYDWSAPVAMLQRRDARLYAVDVLGYAETQDGHIVAYIGRCFKFLAGIRMSEIGTGGEL